MTVRINKQSINLREKLSELDKPSGLTGEELLRSGTSSEARDALDLEEHLFEEFESTGIDDNATSTVVTVSDSGVDVTGTVTADGLTVDGDAQVGALIGAGVSTNLDIGNVISRAYPAARLESYRTSGNFSTTLGIKTLNTTGDLVSRVLVGDNGDVSFYEDTGTTAKMVWNAGAERLGIGTGSPQDEIHIEANYPQIRIASDLNIINSNNLTSTVDGYGNDGIAWRVGRAFGSGDFQIVNHRASATTFDNGGSERMRLDSSGNLLVGTTNADPAGADVAGTAIGSTGYLSMSRSGGAVGIFNRKTNDGNILEFNKDGSTVGSIGSHSGGGTYFYSNSGSDSGLTFWSNTIAPSDSAGGFRDAAINLGSSGGRFKDLYLSGGVYLGGTGAANKLDDYEEGAFTPYFFDDSNGEWAGKVANSGSYTKVGNCVTINAQVHWTSKPSSGWSTLRVRGLPFVPQINNTGISTTDYNEFADVTNLMLRVSSSDILFYINKSLQGAGLASQASSSGFFRVNITYLTNA